MINFFKKTNNTSAEQPPSQPVPPQKKTSSPNDKDDDDNKKKKEQANEIPTKKPEMKAKEMSNFPTPFFDYLEKKFKANKNYGDNEILLEGVRNILKDPKNNLQTKASTLYSNLINSDYFQDEIKKTPPSKRPDLYEKEIYEPVYREIEGIIKTLKPQLNKKEKNTDEKIDTIKKSILEITKAENGKINIERTKEELEREDIEKMRNYRDEIKNLLLQIPKENIMQRKKANKIIEVVEKILPSLFSDLDKIKNADNVKKYEELISDIAKEVEKIEIKINKNKDNVKNDDVVRLRLLSQDLTRLPNKIRSKLNDNGEGTPEEFEKLYSLEHGEANKLLKRINTLENQLLAA